MKEVFIKKYWPDENVLFYLHFENDQAVQQIEITPNGKVLLSLDMPNKDGSMLYDQSLEELDLNKNDFITKEEFYRIWNEK